MVTHDNDCSNANGGLCCDCAISKQPAPADAAARQHVLPGDPADLGTIALQWYVNFDWGAPHSTRESNMAVEGFKDGYRAALKQPAPAEVEAALATFTEYFVKNYPGPNTIISNPHWHAPKIFRAALNALTTPAPPRPVGLKITKAKPVVFEDDTPAEGGKL